MAAIPADDISRATNHASKENQLTIICFDEERSEE